MAQRDLQDLLEPRALPDQRALKDLPVRQGSQVLPERKELHGSISPLRLAPQV